MRPFTPDPVDADLLRGLLSPKAGQLLDRLDVFEEVDSTNACLLDTRPRHGAINVCLAERQRRGRGRRGRTWSSLPAASALCLSVGWRFDVVPPELQALALAAGVVTRRSLRRLMDIETELKWPNDLVRDGRKLGGILVEVAMEPDAGCYVVIGLGLNIAVPVEALDTLSDWPRGATDLALAGTALPSRAVLAGALIESFADLFGDYARTGFAPYRAEYAQADCLAGHSVRVSDEAEESFGIARGVEADGALRVESNGRCSRVLSGDVSVRVVQETI